jgi:flagellar assembly protein FliH
MSSSAEARRFAPLSPLASPGAVDVRDERQAARALGYAEGWSSGTRAAAAQAEALRSAMLREHEQVVDATRAVTQRAVAGLDAAARQLLSTTAPTVDEAGDVVLEAALALARAILGAELAVVDVAAQAALRRALRPLPTGTVVTVRLNPADHAAVQEVVTPGPSGELFEGYELRLVADPAVNRGDAVAEQAGALVDAGIESALARALDVLRGNGGAS